MTVIGALKNTGERTMAPAIAVMVDELYPRRDAIGGALARIDCAVTFLSTTAAAARIAHAPAEVVILAAGAKTAAHSIDCLKTLRAAGPRCRFMFIATDSSEDFAIEALNAGAERYIREPWTAEQLQCAVRDLECSSHSSQQSDFEVNDVSCRLIGRSAATRSLRAHLERVAPAGSNVLITGETGTGKELVAEVLHLRGPRADRPFICLNTAAIPDALLENELFGHERGAYSGAMTAHCGKLAAANGGTVFLDEIGDVSLAVQAKLLRAIEGKPVYRLGGTRSVELDVRVVAATNQDLHRATAEGRFRKDLYYRLNVIRIDVPPLRERREDIPLLVAHYIDHFNRTLRRSVRGLSPRAMDTLYSYDWPGNVRELRNILEALLVNLAPETTGLVDVPSEVMRQLAFAVGSPLSERERLLRALTATNWNKSKAATQLQWSRMTLYRKMQLHNVHPRP